MAVLVLTFYLCVVLSLLDATASADGVPWNPNPVNSDILSITSPTKRLRSSGSMRMDCGEHVETCGVLTLESGLGNGFYEHRLPAVHGLWPQVGHYGTSKCIPPADFSEPTVLYNCYKADAQRQGIQHQLQFEVHEWEKHGWCAGCRDEQDYFEQICSLSKKPLRVITARKQSVFSVQDSKPRVFDRMTKALKQAGYPVYSVDDGEYQIMLSACLDERTGKWKLSSVEDFAAVCSSKGNN